MEEAGMEAGTLHMGLELDPHQHRGRARQGCRFGCRFGTLAAALALRGFAWLCWITQGASG